MKTALRYFLRRRRLGSSSSSLPINAIVDTAGVAIADTAGQLLIST